MGWVYKIVLTAAMVASMLWVAQLFGRRVAGILAGQPTVTGPALIWLALEFGTDYAIEAAIGSIAACALCAVFALAYERASRRTGTAVALLVACAASLALALPLQWLDNRVFVALAVSAIGVVIVYVAMPDANEATRSKRELQSEIWLTALVSGIVSGAVALAAPRVGPFWAGVLASPPLIAAAVAMHQHAFEGNASVRRFLRGYVAGLLGRAVFGAGFAVLIAPFGVPGATLLAAAAGCVITIATLRWIRPQARRAIPRFTSHRER